VSRLSLSRQLLVLQMCIVVLVVATVAGFSLIQTDQTFRKDESRRMLGAAETTANEALIRSGMVTARTPEETANKIRVRESLLARIERARVSAGASYAVLVDVHGQAAVSTLPEGRDAPAGVKAAVVDGASWSGESQRFERRTIEAQVPVFGDGELGASGEVIGFLVVGRFYPSRLEVIGTAAPNVFLYLALAGAIGVAGSLLLARRVKRQTLGLEPGEIAALVEQREAMLHGVREGVLGVDLNAGVAFVNDEAVRLLGLGDDVLGRSVTELGQHGEVAAILSGEVRRRDLVVAVGPRLLVLNNEPIRVRGRQTGWVTSMRDRTELLELQHELAEAHAGTDTLRAQVHEFRNRLHAISGMAELGQQAELQDFVSAVMSQLDSRLDEVSDHLADPAVAALVVAKASRADELGIEFTLGDDAHLHQHAPALSADLVTVVGNLVDNAFDAIGGAGGSVVLDVADDGERIEVVVRDTGRGIPDEDLSRVFELGWTTKDGAGARGHGFGLALTRMACQRNGGSVRVENRDGAVLSAELFVQDDDDD
jgi:two-component system, CitB family, sensor kinase